MTFPPILVKNAVRIDRNMTVLRLPEEVRDAEVMRLVIFDTDKDTQAISVCDILEGPRNWTITIFNANREFYKETGVQVIFEKVS